MILPSAIILATTNKNDAILDPFLGTGTTAVVAKKLGRKYFGIEKDKKYFEAANERINKRSKINYFGFHVTNPLLKILRNFFLKRLVKNKNFIQSYLGKIYK